MRRTFFGLCLFLFAFSTLAQTTGIPPFGSFDAGRFDTVNVGNLNTNFSIPIVSTPGRVTPFNLSIIYDSLIWRNAGQSGGWVPVTDNAGNAIWGWKTTWPLGDLLFKHTVTNVLKKCSIDNYQYLTTERYDNYTYRDTQGTTHPFPTFWQEVTNGCTGSVTDTSQLTGNATDGSGYYIDINLLDNPTAWTASGLSVKTNAEDTNGNITTKVVVNGNETDWTDTAGRTAVRVVTNGSNTEYHYKDQGGNDQFFTLKRQLYSIKTAFACTNIPDYNTGGTLPQVNLPYEFDLPNGQKYQFTYEPTPNSTGFYTGRIRQITLPTGGTITYTYPTTPNNGINCADGTAINLSRAISDGTNTGTWNYVRNLTNGTSTITVPQLTDTPNGNDIVYTFGGTGEISRKIYGNSPGTNLLRTINTTWAANGTPATQVTILEDGARQSEVDTTFDSNGLLDSVSEYDYGQSVRGSLIRTTTLTYQTGSAYTSRKMINLVTQKLVKDANNVTQFRQDINYDENGYVNATCITGAAQHDDTSYGCSFATRGLPTSVIGYANASAGTGALTQHISYDSLGNAVSVTDAAGNATSISYTDNYSDSTNHSSYAQPTTVTRPTTSGNTHVSHTSYYYNFALPYQVTDENGRISTFSYDLLRRSLSATDPTNAVVNFSYTGSTSAEATLNFNSGNSTVDSLATADPLGRVQVQQVRQAPSSSTFDSVQRDYDLVGRVRRTSTPYSGTAGQTNATSASTTTFDVLGRPSSITDANNGTASYTYSLNDVLVTIGPAPSGESTKRRQLEYDGVGRLTSVCELTGGTGSGSCAQKSSQSGFWTKYTYDILDNLTGVTQNAQSTGSQQTRSYVFDSLSRLTSETNAESGTTSYYYDVAPAAPGLTCVYGAGGGLPGNTGNYPGDLAKKYDANGNTTCFSYDALHRATGVTYGGPNAASNKYFVYDSATVNGAVMQNTKGRLAEAMTCPPGQLCGTITDVGFSYTARGEVSDLYESTPHSGGYYHLNQTYWPHGLSNQLSGLPGVPTISYGVDGEGRASAVSASAGQNPVTSVSYNNASLPTQVNFGSGDNDIFAYDSATLRMTQFKFNVGTSSLSLTGNLTWNPNGTLGQLALTDQFNSADTQTCNYAHDDLTRIASANCGAAASQTFSYDAFGNISKSGSPYAFQPTYTAATNRFATIPGATPSYDANGNVTGDGSHTYAWDADGRPVTLDTVGLTFDALGRMVEQNRSGSYTEIVYGPGGDKLALMNGQLLVKAFVPLPGGATAVYTSSGLDHYRHSDWLGSTRLTSSPSRTYVSSTAYAPYGEPYAQSGTQDLSFTGEGQDTVSGDYDFLFREYSIQGRWPSPDPAGLAAVDPTNPQSWNRYAYVMDDPLALADPFGLWALPCDPKKEDCPPPGSPADPLNPDLPNPDPGGLAEKCGPNMHLEPVPFGQARCVPGQQAGEYQRDPKPRGPTIGPARRNPSPPNKGPDCIPSVFNQNCKRPTCLLVFLDASEAADPFKGYLPPNADEAAKVAAATAVTQRVVARGLVQPLSSRFVRLALLAGEVAADAILILPTAYQGSVGLYAEYKARKEGTCRTAWESK
jgi:RHS repeat-associated protein